MQKGTRTKELENSQPINFAKKKKEERKEGREEGRKEGRK